MPAESGWSAFDPIADIGDSDRNPAMRKFIPVVALALVPGCGEASTAKATLEGTAVFFNFYDEPVEVFVDDNLLFSERLEVDDSSTGHSKTLDISLSGCSEVKVVTASHQAEREICLRQGGFGLWVSPQISGGPITIEFEEVFTPALD